MAARRNDTAPRPAPPPAPVLEMEGDEDARRRGINSVEIGFRVLSAVMSLKGPGSLKHIAQAAQMDSSQAHRYVSSLVNCGILKQDASSGLYDLGPGALRIGLAAMARLDFLAVTETALRGFTERTQATTYIAIWGAQGPTIIRWLHGSPPVYTTIAVGSLLPVTHSAVGRAFMSFLPDAMTSPFLEKEGWRSPVGKNPELVAHRDRIRSTRLSTVDCTLVPGLRAHAAPVLGINNALLCVIGIAAADSTPRAEDKVVKQKLVELSREISSELGAPELVAIS